jgi:Mg-chelatase subunit ChlD
VQVTKFCDDSTHFAYAITKQNIYCHRRSVWSILESLPEFQDGSQPVRNDLKPEELKPVVKFFKAAVQNVIFAVDVSSSMNAVS